MTGRQTDKYTMLLVVLNFLKNSDEDIMVQMPHFDEVLQNFETMTEKLGQLYRTQTLSRTGTRITKLRLRSEMTVLALTTASRLEAYAIAIEDNVLQQEVTVKEYLLKKSRENALACTCQFIHNKAQELLPQLAAYGITTQTLADFNESIQDYAILIPKTRAGIVTRSMSTNQIKQLFTDFDHILLRMDKLVTMLRFSNPNFYETYFSNRKIITRGTRKQALRGTVKDQDGNPLDRVEVTINTTPNITTKTGNKGHYHFNHLPSGVYPITVTRLGYQPETIFLAITSGVAQQLNIQLKKQLYIEKTA